MAIITSLLVFPRAWLNDKYACLSLMKGKIFFIANCIMHAWYSMAKKLQSIKRWNSRSQLQLRVEVFSEKAKHRQKN
jgi:hypothetical protein